jgi:hypothetical protein
MQPVEQQGGVPDCTSGARLGCRVLPLLGAGQLLLRWVLLQLQAAPLR